MTVLEGWSAAVLGTMTIGHDEGDGPIVVVARTARAFVLNPGGTVSVLDTARR